ncbi:hypothetical protein LY90DRAFT_505945 [Neocallimastix californiae]|uniref:SSD domain-containing protein n=1 Tax=Neocallimastix californiae TaxID=1754190 RepID=A0A1Y2DKQ5_9FUNG|nr:hypothetical protein LY90DRAFT_505945 [Neocallimastix californiae]|eukprot:ORY59833.1 hypothetical protein LY90DRAFT_505945 [Neocallimastix californiae]
MPSEYIVLFFIYLALFFYISSSIGKVQVVKSKYRLGFVAVVSVSLSLIISVGFIEFLLGINSSMFYPWSVFPYLIMTVGIENILVIVKSVVNTSIELPFNERYALGMKNISLELFNPLIINIIIIGCGSLSTNAPIVEFCFYTSLCIIFNFWLQICLFGTALSLDIKKLELYDLYVIQSKQNHRIIEQSGNNVKYNQVNENKPYHPLLDVKNEGLNDLEKEEELDTYYYSENYNKTYDASLYGKYYLNDYPDIITSLSHILPKYWVHFKNNYNKKINVEESVLSSMDINYYVVINSLVHISVDAEFEKLYEPDTKVLGLSINKLHPFAINILISLDLITLLIMCMISNSLLYILYKRTLEYSKRIKSSLIHILYYFFPFYEYETFFGKKYIIPLYQPTFLAKVNRDKLEKYQTKINYELSFSSSLDIHIINGGDYESIDYIIIKNPDKKSISSHHQDNFNTEDEKAIILWGGRHSSIYIWSSEPLIKKSKAQDKKVGVYYYRNPYIALKKYLEEENKDELFYFIKNYCIYINKPTFKCQMNASQNISNLSMDVFNDYILMTNKNIFYQWEYYNKKINYFDILKDKNDEILWILNSNENFGDIKKHMINQYLHNQQIYDSRICSQLINSEEPYFITVITKAGRLITLDDQKHLINTIELKETLDLYHYSYHRNNSIVMNDSSPQDSSLTTNVNYNIKNNVNIKNINNSNVSYHLTQHNNAILNNTINELTLSTSSISSSPSPTTSSSTYSPILKSPTFMDNIPVCYHYDTLNRVWISFKNKIIICYQLPMLQPLFILNENDMQFTVLYSQAQNEININKNNNFYTENNNKYWSRHYKGNKNSNSDYDHYINEKLFISRGYSKIMISNEEVGWLVTSDATGYMTVWNTKEGKVWDNVKCPSSITKIYIIKSTSKVNNWWIVSSHEDETVRLWNTNAGILSCSEVWYQPGCSTIACHNGVIVGARRVCIREKTVIENIILEAFINIALCINFFVNIFIHHNNKVILDSIEMIYQYLKLVHFSKNIHPEECVWMWQIWIYNVDTEMNRYINFAVDKLNGLGVPKQRIISMPRENFLFQIYDLSVQEDVNGHPAFTNKFKNKFKKSIGINETQQTLHKYMKKLNVHELGQIYNEIPSDINIEDLGYSLNIKPNEEFFISFPDTEHPTPKEVEEKEQTLKAIYHQPPVLKINHININSRLICFDFGKQIRIIN